MSVSPSPRLHAALVEGRYTIRQKLGSGSLGTVYLAWDEEAKRLVALKIIRTEQLIPEGSTSMQDEFRAFALIQHPRIAKAYDFGYTGAGIPYYTREYIAGSPLPSGPPGREPPGKFLRPVLDLLESLEYLHSQGVLHLDIHAGNLIVAEDEARGSVLIDFGLVRSLDQPPFSSRRGSWAALPPELLESKEASPRTDLFLVGRLLHYRLTGRTQGKPSLPREIPGWGTRLTLDLERAIAKALQPSPEERFQSAAEFRKVLCKILGEKQEGPVAAEPGQSIFGRDSELEAIEEALRAAGQGAPGLLWLFSKRGLGKTRLIAESRLRAQLRGFQTVEVRFLPDPGPEPALFQALRSVKARSKAFAAWLDPLDPSCGGTSLERARRAAQAYFRGEERPLVLLLDDLDLADRQSRDLAEALAAECVERQEALIRRRGMALLITSSEAPSRQLIPRGGGTRVRALKPLDPGTGRDLFRDLLRPLEAPEPLVRRAVRAARGSPLHIRHIALSLRAEWGQRSSIPVTAQLPAVASSPPGAGLQGWESLSDEDRQVLETIAVLSRAATEEELSAVLKLPGESIGRSLRRLVKLDVLLAQGHRRARRYQIVQPEVRKHVAGGISAQRARRIHEAMASFLQEAIASPGA